MPTVEPVQKPRQLKNISMTLSFPKADGTIQEGPVEFRKVVQSFQFTPQQTIATVLGGTPDAQFSDVSGISWQLAVKFLQDAETLSSLTDYLFKYRGQRAIVSFVPYGGTGWAATVRCPAPPIGGDFNAWLSDTVTFGCLTEPYRTVDDPTTDPQV